MNDPAPHVRAVALMLQDRRIPQEHATPLKALLAYLEAQKQRASS